MQSPGEPILAARATGGTHLGKLRWHCRRGMRELDVLLRRFLDERYADAGEAQQAAFRRLLELQDPLINAYLLGREMPPDPSLTALIARITAPADRLCSTDPEDGG